jgi:hypothetical protein
MKSRILFEKRKIETVTEVKAHYSNIKKYSFDEQFNFEAFGSCFQKTIYRGKEIR